MDDYGDDVVDVGDDSAKQGGKATDHMSNTFYDRIARGNNLTKMGSGSKPRDVAMLIAAQARAPVDCPTLQAIGPQATNQAVKAIAIARTFLKESQSIDICMQPEFFQLDDGHTGLLLPIRKKTRRARSGEDEAQPLKAASGTDSKVLAGAISSFAREGRRMVVTGIGAAAINQVRMRTRACMCAGSQRHAALLPRYPPCSSLTLFCARRALCSALSLCRGRAGGQGDCDCAQEHRGGGNRPDVQARVHRGQRQRDGGAHAAARRADVERCASPCERAAY